MTKNHFSGFKLGVNVFVIRNGNLLLGKRATGLGKGQWGLPGGHVEQYELIMDAAKRELVEETGLTAQSFDFLNVVNSPRPGLEKHYVHIAVLAHDAVGEPTLCEPHACYEWKWFALNDLPEPLFFGHVMQIQLFKEQKLFGEEVDAHNQVQLPTDTTMV